MPNHTKVKDSYIQRIISEVNKRGRLTSNEVAIMLGISMTCARLYSREAAKKGNLIRHLNSGLFRDRNALDEMHARRIMKKRKPVKVDVKKINHNGNVIFHECRQSEVMKRVLAFYGKQIVSDF